MLFDDRLATVLRHRAAGERAARTQFRQLLDLLARHQRGADESLRAAAWLRLAALGEAIPADVRAAMIRDPALRFHSAELAAHFAEDEPVVAAAALNKAQLRDDDWEALIPRLPIRARGFLRLRDDLPPGAMRLLDRLGISDRGLPEPSRQEPADSAAIIPDVPERKATITPPAAANDALGQAVSADIADETAEPATEPREATSIGTLVERIEAFQKERSRRPGQHNTAHETRQAGGAAPLLPLGEERDLGPPPLLGFAFTTDAVGRIDWADPQVAPSAMYLSIPPLLPSQTRKAFMQRLPLERAPVSIDGAPVIAGEWILDAAPRFTDSEGSFFGYAGRMRRAAQAPAAGDSAANRESDTLRQLLHELRTPVNAIQGFAELIQQQLFGPVPHEYRALAAGIAGDSARMLAGFDELDRLAKLESGAMDLDAGSAEHAEVVSAVSKRLAAILDPRNAGFTLNLAEPIEVALTRDDLEAITWRILASLAAGLAPGEKVSLTMVGDRTTSWLEIELPASMAGLEDVFATGRAGTPGAASAGAFGQGFALRLARAEARAAGGDLARVDTRLVLTLPRLTGSEAEPSQADSAHGASG